MRKFYLTAAIASLCNLAFSQSFFVPTTYRGAFAPAPETPWTNQWTNWDCQNTTYPSPTVNVTGNITNNTTWTANNVYLLQGQIYVKNGATLTIEPGTIILGDKNTAGSGLFITQGAKINAAGTASQPIVFTSNQPAGQRAAGDWGGIILMGRASNNNAGGIANIEGIAPSSDTQYGGGTNPDDNDNSGVLQYVRVEFSGYVYQPNKEINALTFGAVGRGTTVDHIQVSFGNDDAFEWFGGTVNCRYLVSYRNLDDDFDADNGFNGKVQFGLVVRDPNIADNPSVSTSEGFEIDNDASGSAATPQTSPIFSNITLVGPLRGNTGATVASGFRRGARFRRNSAIKVYNSVFTDFLRGVHIDGSACESNATNGLLKFENNLIAGNQTGKVTEVNSGSSFGAPTWFGTNDNDSLVATTGIFTNPYDYLNADFRPAVSSPLLTDYAFNDASIDPYVIYAPVATTSISYCVGETATPLTATAAHNDLTIKWYTQATGGSAITTPTPSTAGAGTFVYYAAQSTADGTEGPRTMITVTVNANPTAPIISANGSTSLCTGSSVELSSNQTSGNTWSTNATSQTITVATSGTYAVVYTDANGCEATSNSITVSVSDAPVPTIQANGSLTICEGSSVTLTASTSDTYLWSNSETTQSITVTEAGTYTVTVTNADACDGVGTSEEIIIVVNPQPVASFTMDVTNGYTVAFTSTSVSATSVTWDFGDGTMSTLANPTHIYANSDDYTVTLTATNGTCTDTETFNLTDLSVKEVISSEMNVNLFPNPVSNNGTLVINVNNATPVTIEVIDFKGSLVSEVTNTNIEAGKHEFTVPASQLENGMYYVVIRTVATSKTIKMNVLK